MTMNPGIFDMLEKKLQRRLQAGGLHWKNMSLLSVGSLSRPPAL